MEMSKFLARPVLCLVGDLQVDCIPGALAYLPSRLVLPVLISHRRAHSQHYQQERYLDHVCQKQMNWSAIPRHGSVQRP